MPEETLRHLVEQAIDFEEPSVTSGSIGELLWLPNDPDDIYLDSF